MTTWLRRVDQVSNQHLPNILKILPRNSSTPRRSARVRHDPPLLPGVDYRTEAFSSSFRQERILSKTYSTAHGVCYLGSTNDTTQTGMSRNGEIGAYTIGTRIFLQVSSWSLHKPHYTTSKAYIHYSSIISHSMFSRFTLIVTTTLVPPSFCYVNYLKNGV